MFKDFKPEIKLLFLVASIAVVISLAGILVLRNDARNQVSHTPSPVVSGQPAVDVSDQYTELDGKVWSDVNQIVTAVNLHYAEMERLPKSLEELISLPDLAFFQVDKNPITGKSYVYTVRADGSGFMVSGTQSDGLEYIREIPIK